MAFRRISLLVPNAFCAKILSIANKSNCIRVRSLSTDCNQAMNYLDTVVSRLKSIAPLSLAGSWDNVGLLVEPSSPKYISKIMLTNDLTAAVMEEAKDKTVDLILSYHPPIFVPVKRLTQTSWKEKILIDCMENRIAVFSPHTSYDAVQGGVNDWLISAFDVNKESVTPLEPTENLINSHSHALEVDTEPSDFNEVWKTMTSGLSNESHLKKNKSSFSTSTIKIGSVEKWRIRVECSQSELNAMLQGIMSNKMIDQYSVTALSKVPERKCGMGRWAKLKDPITLEQAIELVKNHLNLNHLNVARTEGCQDNMIKTVAVCAGSGSSVLKNARADLLVTGEMSHHQVLDAVHADSNVILCNHSNTERGFLTELQKKLIKVMEKSIQVFVSESDKDPLQIM